MKSEKCRARLNTAFVPAAKREDVMYMVYWTVVKEGNAIPHSQAFASDEMAAAMTFMEALRSRQRAGEGLGFITMSSEHPDSVGHPGVADPSPDYAWKKRRK